MLIKIENYIYNVLESSKSNIYFGIGNDFYIQFVLLNNKYNHLCGITDDSSVVNDASFNCFIHNIKYICKIH